ncbi:hypothetical protein KAX06_03795 [candidate division WOR-3 bacterium]|nr:hypothetical protein [candidate division WOR-3 bacterium]
MKRYLPALVLLLLLAWLPLACDKDKEPEVWLWSYQDSLDVMELLEPEQDFLSSKGHLPDEVVAVALLEDIQEAIRQDTSSVRYLVSEFSFSISDSSYGFKFDLGIDTTITTYVVDTLKGSIELKVDSLFERGSDSALAADTTVLKMLRYSSRGDVFFDSLGGDAAWRTLKYSGGITGSTPEVATAPSFDSLILAYPAGGLTVISSAEEGAYGMRGLFETNDLIHVSPGESVSVEDVFVSGNNTLLIYLADDKGNWSPYESGAGVAFTSKGKSRLYIIGIRLAGFVYPSDEWSSVIWGIPVIVD